MNPIFVKTATVVISAFMNILGTIAIPHIGAGAFSLLIIWNLFVMIIVIDDHKRTEKREKDYRKKIDHWMIRHREEQIKNIEREEENQK